MTGSIRLTGALLVGLMLPAVAGARQVTVVARAAMPNATRDGSGAAIGTTIYAVCGSPSGAYAYYTDTNTWVTLSSPLTSRDSQAAVAFGNKIYVFGGWAGGATSSADVYDTDTHAWSNLANMPAARQRLAAARVGTSIYVVCGEDGSVNPMADVYMYDPPSNTYSTGPSAPVGWGALCAASMGTTIFAMGGQAGEAQAHRVLDTSKSLWYSRAGLPVNGFLSAAQTAAGRLYFCGSTFNSAKGYDAFLEYDPAVNSWTELDRIPGAKSDLASAAIAATVYLVGGWTGGSALDNVWACYLHDAGLGATASVSSSVDGTAHVFTVYVTVSNSGTADANNVVTTIVGSGPAELGLAAVGSTVSNPVTINAGGSVQSAFTFRATGGGAATFTVRTNGWDSSLGGAIWDDEALTRTVTAVPAAPAAVTPGEPAAGKALASPNFLDRSNPSVPVRVAFRGETGGTVKATLYDERGAVLRTWELPLDASGRATLTFDGKNASGSPLGTGLYWLRASGGGVNDRIRLAVTNKVR